MWVHVLDNVDSPSTQIFRIIHDRTVFCSKSSFIESHFGVARIAAPHNNYKSDDEITLFLLAPTALFINFLLTTSNENFQNVLTPSILCD